MKDGWTTIQCSRCDGYGQVSVYTIGGTAFEGPGWCPQCGGNGALWVSPKGRLALWPGGPFAGSLAKGEA